MALFAGKNQALQIPSPPNLPLAGLDSPDRLYLDQLNNVLRLYFTQMSSALSTVAGDEGGQYLSFPFGSFYDTTTQTAAATSTAYPVKFGTTDLTNSVTVVTDGTNLTRITVDESGIYNFAFSLQLIKAGASSKHAWIWPRINGVDVPNSATKVGLVGNNAASVAAWNFFLSLTAGDYVQLMWAVEDTAIEILYETATAFCPAIPSTILTVNFVSYIPANPSA